MDKDIKQDLEKLSDIKKLMSLFKDQQTFVRMAKIELKTNKDHVSLFSDLCTLMEIGKMSDKNILSGESISVSDDLIFETKALSELVLRKNQEKFMRDPEYYSNLVNAHEIMTETRRELSSKESLFAKRKANELIKMVRAEIVSQEPLVEVERALFFGQVSDSIEELNEFLSASENRQKLIELKNKSVDKTFNPESFVDLVHIKDSLILASASVDIESFRRKYSDVMSVVFECDFSGVESKAVKQLFANEIQNQNEDVVYFLIDEIEGKMTGKNTRLDNLKDALNEVKKMDQDFMTLYKYNNNYLISDGSYFMTVSDDFSFTSNQKVSTLGLKKVFEIDLTNKSKESYKIKEKNERKVEFTAINADSETQYRRKLT